MDEVFLRSWIKRLSLGLICVFALGEAKAQSFNGTSNTGCISGTGGTIALEIKNAQPVAGSGTLTFYAAGDLDGSTEYFDLLDENSNTIAKSINTTQCSGYGSVTVTVSQTTLAGWAADGVIKFTADASGNVNSPLCGSLDGCAYVKLSYTSKVNGLTAGVRTLVSPVNFCAGTHDITAVIGNSGNKQITSLKVNWSIDGVTQTSITLSGTLDTIGGTGKSDTTLKLGSNAFAANTSYAVKIWTSDPNGSSDTYSNDDTLDITVAPALKGTLTVGGTSPDFATLSAAVSALNSYGLCGPVTFDIRSGTYTERLVINEITGASAANTITFKGAGKGSTTLTFKGTSTSKMQTLLLDGADYITFRDMTIANTGSSYGVVVHLTDEADHNTIEDCELKSSTTGTSSYLICILGSGSRTSYSTSGNSGNYNLFKGNTLTGGRYGVLFRGAGTGSGSYVMGNQFIDNSITSYYYYGVYLYYHGEAVVRGNTISSTRQTTTYGLYFWYASNFEVTRNEINVNYHACYMYYGNYYNWNGTSRSVIANNIFNSMKSGYGMYSYRPYYVDFFHNTIRGKGATYSASIHYAQEADLRNNIMVNERSGTSTAYYANNNTYLELDNNIYYAPNSSQLIYYDGTYYTDLKAWQGALPQYNTVSLEQDPGFVSATDLHLNTSGTKPYGTDLGLGLDVDGDTRCKFAPTIGADESVLGKTVRPTAGITAPDTIFTGSPVEVLGNRTANVPHTNVWYLDGKFVKDSADLLLTISSKGTYTLKVVAQGCSLKDSTTKTIVVVDPSQAPVPDFIATGNLLKPGETIQITDLTSGGPTAWHWEISPSVTYDLNGNPIDMYTYTYGDDSSRTVRVRFDEPGGYKVCLTATNSQGSATICKEKYIRVFPTYNLSTVTLTANDSVGFIYDNGGPGGNYSANRTTSMLLAPCASEVYLVIEKFELECGDDYLRIYDGEDNSGTPLHCTGNSGSSSRGPGLTGLSTATCGVICRPSKSDTFKATSGKMYLEMATDGNTQYAGFEAYWWVKPKKVDAPEASFEFPSTICMDIPVRFTNTSTGESVNYFWDLDGDMSQFETTSDDASYVYFAPGKYEITLVAANCGGTDTFRKEITVISPPAPRVSFSADNTYPTINDVVRFIPDIKECVSEYFWRFAPASGNGKAVLVNGTGKTSEFPLVTFSDTGCYNVFLFAKNTGGEDSLELNCFIRVKNPYCVPSVATNVTDLGISEVSVHTLLKKSSQGIEDHQNFVATDAVTLEIGASYDLTVKRTTNLNEITRTAWIDWNLDGDFADNGEKIGEEKNSVALAWTKTFSVPVKASIGATVLRIASNQGTLSNLACGMNKYGEYEDYRVYVTPDLTPPVITLLGDDTVYVEQGYTYTDSGATAKDNLNGNITHLIKKSVTPAFDNLIPGTYYFRFNVQDSAGNAADMVTRVVIVTEDKTAPHLIVTGTDTIYVAVGDNSFSELVATFAEDLVDGDLSGQVVRSGNVDVNKVGIYILEYTISDFSGNGASERRTIIVEDRIAPVLTRNGSDTVYHEVNTPYTDAGAAAADNYYTDLDTAIIVLGKVNETRPGTYKLVYTLKDPSGNDALPVERVVIVRDSKAPLISLDGDTLIIVEVFGVFSEPGTNVSDNYGTPALTTSGTYYQSFPDGIATLLGDYTVIYTATDSFGNSASVTRTVRVADTEAPSITLKGTLSANVCRWAAYADAGYELDDNYWDTADITVQQEGNFENSLLQGVYSLRYRAEDKSGNVAYSGWRIINVLSADEGPCITAISVDQFEKSISVYPNPTTGRFTVSMRSAAGKQVEMRIVNALGELIETVYNPAMAGDMIIDMSSHSSGVYMLHITDGSHTSIKKLIVRD